MITETYKPSETSEPCGIMKLLNSSFSSISSTFIWYRLSLAIEVQLCLRGISDTGCSGVGRFPGREGVTHPALASHIRCKLHLLWFLVAKTTAQYLKLDNSTHDRTPTTVLQKPGWGGLASLSQYKHLASTNLTTGSGSISDQC